MSAHPDDSAAVKGPWAPLHNPIFRSLWIASIVSNIGGWMQNVGAGWLMTSLAASPVMVAMIQAATSFPIFLLALPAGALADVVNRRWLLVATQTWMAFSAAVLGVLTLTGLVNEWWLLALTASIGAGTAMTAPAWQANVSELISRANLPAAVALNSAGFNLSRAIGPAIGGLIIAAIGPGAIFVLNAVSFLGVIGVLVSWRYNPEPSTMPAERFFGAMRSGIRYVRHAPAVQAVLVRTFLFAISATSLWALLPIVAREHMRMGPFGYGALLACLGIGALCGAYFLPGIRARMGTDKCVAIGTIAFAISMIGAGFLDNAILTCALMLPAGAAWLTNMSSFNVAVQSASPMWVRARALSIYLLSFSGSMAIGSVLWGSVANHVGTPIALTISAGTLLLGLALIPKFSLHGSEGLDLTPSMIWEEPAISRDPPLEGAPVLVTIEYRIDPSRVVEFKRAMEQVRRQRLRDGALRWELLGDAAVSDCYVEVFVVESWIEHLRQHARTTVADRDVEDAARSFHIGDQPIQVRHLIAERA
jgi:MFS family permease